MYLAQNGAKKVFAVDINNDALQKLKLQLETQTQIIQTQIIHTMVANCAVESDMRRIILTVENEHGPIDAFFCNAGILSVGTTVDTPNDEWELSWKINVMQIVYVSKYLLPIYEKRRIAATATANNLNMNINKKNSVGGSGRGRGGGALIITASAAGLLSQPGTVAYTATKHAAVALAEWLNMTYRSKGIQVSCLCPQGVRTPMLNGTDGGPAGVDGVMDADDVARITVEQLEKGKFLIAPHEKVIKYVKDKGNDYEKWLRKMGKFNSLMEGKFTFSPLSLPHMSRL